MATTASGNLGNGYCVLWNHNTGDTMTVYNLYIDAQYEIGPVPGKRAYQVKVRFRLASTSRMNYSGLHCELSVYCNGVCIANNADSATLGLQGTGTSSNPIYSQYSPEYTYIYEVSSKQSTINLQCVGDLSKVTGINTGVAGGPDSNSHKNYHYHELYCSGSINVEGITIGEPPTLNYLINKAPFTYMDRTKDDVSLYMDKIVLSWSGSWGDPADDSHVYYRVNDGSVVDAGHVDPFTISGLSPGVTYKIDAYVQNSIGATGWKSISIRTMYEIPNVTHTITPDLEEFIISWVSNRPLESLTCDVYEILDQGTKPSKKKRIITHDVPITPGDTSGTFKTCDLPPYPKIEGNCVLNPKTLYEVLVYGMATWEWDCRDFTLTHPYLYTLDRSHITAVSACTFGLPIDITIEGESEKHHKLKIWTEGNDLLPTFVFDDLEKGVYTFNPTQEQLDKMYRSIPNTGNIVPIHFLVTTHGDHLDYDDQQVDKTMTLTGIAKTAHVGDASNNPRRCQVWIGDANNNPRRVVMWVGDGSGNPRRTI